MKHRLYFFLVGSALLYFVFLQTEYMNKKDQINTLKSEHNNYVDSLTDLREKDSQLILLLKTECKRLENECQRLSSTIAQKNYENHH
jgi:predicted  nucleic acid-binding Zn-ribbon protein